MTPEFITTRSTPPGFNGQPQTISVDELLARHTFDSKAGLESNLSLLIAETRESAKDVARDRLLSNFEAGNVILIGILSGIGGSMGGCFGACGGILYGSVLGLGKLDAPTTGAAIGVVAAVLGILCQAVKKIVSDYKADLKKLNSDNWQGYLERLLVDLRSGRDPELVINWLVSETEKQYLFPRELRTPLLCTAMEYLDLSRPEHSGSVVTACEFAVKLPAAAKGYRILQLAAAWLEQGRIHDDYRAHLLDSLLTLSADGWCGNGDAARLNDFLEKLFFVCQRDLEDRDPLKQRILQFIISESPKSALVGLNAEEALRALPVDGVLD